MICIFNVAHHLFTYHGPMAYHGFMAMTWISGIHASVGAPGRWWVVSCRYHENVNWVDPDYATNLIHARWWIYSLSICIDQIWAHRIWKFKHMKDPGSHSQTVPLYMHCELNTFRAPKSMANAQSRPGSQQKALKVSLALEIPCGSPS